LDELSKKQSRQFAKSIRFLADGKLPWKIAIIIDATIPLCQDRCRLQVTGFV
jgi:hypothetical protein